jgi:hypothetical protein
MTRTRSIPRLAASTASAGKAASLETDTNLEGKTTELVGLLGHPNKFHRRLRWLAR